MNSVIPTTTDATLTLAVIGAAKASEIQTNSLAAEGHGVDPHSAESRHIRIVFTAQYT